MRTIAEYIKEAKEGEKKLDNERYQYLVQPKTAQQARFQNELKEAIYKMGRDPKVKQRKLTVKADFSIYYTALMKNLESRNIDMKQVRKLLPPAAELGMLINDNFSIFKSVFPGLDKKLTYKESQYAKMAREYNAKYGELLPIEEIGNETVEDGERLVVVRSKWGNGDVLYGVIDVKLDDKLSHQLCAAYHKQTGVAYYEGRPILYNSWLKLSPERQQASATEDGTDTEEFVA